MPQSRTGFALLASLALVLGSTAGASAAPKPKPPPEPAGTLVALGDSFSAGTGTFDRDDTECYRSRDYAYPVLLAERLGANLDFRACEGATTGDVAANQLATMPANTTLVTMTVGGNDVGFADVLTTCALPWNTSSCISAINGGKAMLSGALGTSLTTLYGSIKSKAPNASVTVGGYPHLFNGVNDCSWITSFDTREMAELNKATDELDAFIAARVAEVAGVSYVDPRTIFDNHAVCDSSPYINGYISTNVGESYHPNRAGNVAYADVFVPAGGDSGGGGGKGGGKPKALVAQLRSGNEKVQLAALKRIEVLDERAAASAGR
ncbi:MAG: SGNH/GDSL hydrolase family protein [Intrasporangiaceae bacterium]|nr:SGNH/GDSL hydrolase family protein [Intrasporangiaceae bacterium]